MEVIENNANKTLSLKHKVRCKNCGSILLADDGEIEMRVYRDEYGNIYYMHDGIDVCPCCHERGVQVDVIETLTDYIFK